MKVEKRVTTRYVGEEGFEFMFEPVEDTITVKKTAAGYDARYLVREDNPISPDEDGDDGIFLVGYHQDFTVRRDDIITKDALIEAMSDKDAEIRGKYWILPLEAYIHGGVVLALSREGNFPDRQWDVSQLGAVLVSKKEWPKYLDAKKAAQGLIETWNCNLSGDVYGVVVEKYDAEKKQIDHDACWGYCGYEYALEELKTA
jgi:hypothetical protein